MALINDGILLIDDDVVTLNLVAKQLSGLGYRDIIAVDSASKALSLMASRSFATVISDLNMPGMDGIEFLRSLAAQSSYPGIILLSGVENGILAAVETLAKAFRLNLLGTVSKPAEPGYLHRLISSQDSSAAAEFVESEPLSVETIREGLHADALRFLLQPKVRLRDMRVTGVEALARWRTPEGGQLGAGAFIEVAEKYGMISLVTDAMIDLVVQTISTGSSLLDDITFSINISSADLNDVEFTDRLVSKAADAGVEMSRLVLELTESRVLDDLVQPLDILSRLRLKGVGLAIDDFGTGTSGFDNLRQLPFTELKIDRSFVDGVAKDNRKQSIIASMLDLARAFNLTTVAEGVETEEDLKTITDLGCDMVQGYLFTAPMGYDDFVPWLEEHNRHIAV